MSPEIFSSPIHSAICGLARSIYANQKLTATKKASANWLICVRIWRSRRNMIFQGKGTGEIVIKNSVRRNGHRPARFRRQLKFRHGRSDQFFHPLKRRVFLSRFAWRKITDISPPLQNTGPQQIQGESFHHFKMVWRLITIRDEPKNIDAGDFDLLAVVLKFTADIPSGNRQ